MTVLNDRLLGQSRPDREPKWGVERRRAIVGAMLNPDNRHRRDDVLIYTRKVVRAFNITNFFDEVATEADMQHVERLLGIV